MKLLLSLVAVALTGALIAASVTVGNAQAVVAPAAYGVSTQAQQSTPPPSTTALPQKDQAAKHKTTLRARLYIDVNNTVVIKYYRLVNGRMKAVKSHPFAKFVRGEQGYRIKRAKNIGVETGFKAYGSNKLGSPSIHKYTWRGSMAGMYRGTKPLFELQLDMYTLSAQHSTMSYNTRQLAAHKAKAPYKNLMLQADYNLNTGVLTLAYTHWYKGKWRACKSECGSYMFYNNTTMQVKLPSYVKLLKGSYKIYWSSKRGPKSTPYQGQRLPETYGPHLGHYLERVVTWGHLS